MGTLVVYIVLLESLRQLADVPHDGQPVEFANSFAMPPLSAWTPHVADACFSAPQMTVLGMSAAPPPTTFAGLMHACLRQPPAGEVGPNGALLCAILAHHLQRPLRMWLNDLPHGHYGNALPALAATNQAVQQILGLVEPSGHVVSTCGHPYAQSLTPPAAGSLQATLGAWGHGAVARLGFLDPMRYRIAHPRPAETSSADHGQWLDLLAVGFPGPVTSVHFTGHRNHPELQADVAQMRADGTAHGYPHSVTASHAHYFVVALLRDPGGDAAALVKAHTLAEAIAAQWNHWCAAIGHAPCALTLHVE